MYSSFFKPLLDCIAASIGFIIMLPIFLIIVLLLLISNKGGVFFRQARPGKAGKIFRIVKFKTMNNKKGPDGNLLPDAERLTPIGIFIRKTSLDEIPQLLNVIIGDMSLVGPRPLLVEYLPLYTAEQNRRHEVKPGITGWAQVNGRNAISWSEKFELDVWYVNNIGFFLDIKILFLTIRNVIYRKNITSSTSVTMERFNGN